MTTMSTRLVDENDFDKENIKSKSKKKWFEIKIIKSPKWFKIIISNKMISNQSQHWLSLASPFHSFANAFSLYYLTVSLWCQWFWSEAPLLSEVMLSKCLITATILVICLLFLIVLDQRALSVPDGISGCPGCIRNHHSNYDVRWAWTV